MPSRRSGRSQQIDQREYARLLGYPWGTLLEGDVRERGDQAAEWYRVYGVPRAYCRTVDGLTVTAITAGFEVEQEVERLWECGRVDEAYFLDRYAAAVVEKLAADLGPHRKPGTAGMPFEQQFRLFSYLAPLEPEIEMLPSGMLKPKHSVVAVMERGLKPAATSGPVVAGFSPRSNPCMRCDLQGCTFRRRRA